VGCSPVRNPNGVWQYGYTIEQALVPSAFRRAGFHDGKSSIGFWQPSSIPKTGHYPYVACNPSAKTEYGPGSIPGTRRAWAARAGQVAMEASNSGQYSVIRFTAPVTGSYRVTARFEGIHFAPSTTDVHVMHGARSLFSAEIDGYGGDPALRAVSGANPAAAYAGTVRLEAGDTIDFAVGYGQNRTHYGDTTGLFARVELGSALPPHSDRGGAQGRAVLSIGVFEGDLAVSEREQITTVDFDASAVGACSRERPL
jgi:hypothetical protein